MQHRFQGRGTDSHLNANGKQQAQKLALALRNIPLKAVYTSTLVRTKETAAYVMEYHPQANAREVRGLEEMDYGDYEGDRLADRSDVVKDIIADKWSSGCVDAGWPSGESPQDVVDRGTTAILSLLTQEDHDHVALVCHGRFNKIVLSSLLYSSLIDMNNMVQDNTCVNVLDFDRKTQVFTVVELNNTDHLSN